MTKGDRRAKVTPETRADAARLKHMWEARLAPRLSQAEFGELFDIGNQSAVGQFLRGEVPLSLKAAKGFAKGLGCSVGEFSPSLAKEAAQIAELVPLDSLPPEVVDLARDIYRLPQRERRRVIAMCRQIIALASNGRHRDSEESQSGDGIGKE